jgi:lipopolysaccharide heptosyltransferase II
MKRLLRSAILTFVRLYGAPRAISATKNRIQGLYQAPRILIVRPDHLGDLILVTPILQAIRTQIPDAQITMMLGPWSSEVVARHPVIDRLITCPFPGFQRASQKALEPYTLLFSTAQQLRSDHYDLAINLRPDFWWGAALLYLAAIPQRIGYATELTSPFLTQSLPFPAAEHATVSNLRLADASIQALGYAALPKPYTPASYPLYFKPQPAEQAWVEERLQESDVSTGTPLVVIHPGTGGAVKLWRTDGWAHIAQELSSSHILSAPAQIIFTGSASERPLLEEIAEQMSQHLAQSVMVLTNTTVGQLAALLARADLVLGVDNGPLHIAAAQGTPSLRLFGPTDPHIFGPWGDPEQQRVLAATTPCPGCPLIPCGRLDFASAELPDHPCVRRITEQQVAQEIQTLLATTSTLPTAPGE